MPPTELQPGVPEAVSRIVMKLLEKTAEARYQSAQGLKADLEVCAREWSARHAVTPFPLGAHDVSDRFLIPQCLYGRTREVEQLTSAFDRACAGPAALMLVSGYSGVGKTSLIQELCRPIVRGRGYFISGKFDQVVRNVPYGALLQAFRRLVQQLLTENEEHLALWRARLAEALGASGRVLTEVIPEMELIIGAQATVPPLAAAEAQNRFRLVFQNFVGALAASEHPLVVFLDDLQWADAASLALLQPLLTSADLRFLYLIGAYRDNEVDAGHLLTRTVAALEASGARVDRICLAPLGLVDLTRFAVDCLGRRDVEIEALARLVSTKTEGNPFFVIQFLKTLWQEGLLRFDHEQSHWAFSMDDIAQAPMTDNVIDLMSRKIQRLSAGTQRVLTWLLASAIPSTCARSPSSASNRSRRPARACARPSTTGSCCGSRPMTPRPGAKAPKDPRTPSFMIACSRRLTHGCPRSAGKSYISPSAACSWSNGIALTRRRRCSTSSATSTSAAL